MDLIVLDWRPTCDNGLILLNKVTVGHEIESEAGMRKNGKSV